MPTTTAMVVMRNAEPKPMISDNCPPHTSWRKTSLPCGLVPRMYSAEGGLLMAPTNFLGSPGAIHCAKTAARTKTMTIVNPIRALVLLSSVPIGPRRESQEAELR